MVARAPSTFLRERLQQYLLIPFLCSFFSIQTFGSPNSNFFGDERARNPIPARPLQLSPPGPALMISNTSINKRSVLHNGRRPRRIPTPFLGTAEKSLSAPPAPSTAATSMGPRSGIFSARAGTIAPTLPALRRYSPASIPSQKIPLPANLQSFPQRNSPVGSGFSGFNPAFAGASPSPMLIAPSRPDDRASGGQRSPGSNIDNGPVEPPGPPYIFQGGRTISVSDSDRLYGENTNMWNGCDANSSVQGGFGASATSQNCGPAKLNSQLAHQIDRFLFACVKHAAGIARFPEPSGVFLSHLGSYNNRSKRGGGGLSEHAFARALDIAGFQLRIPGQKSIVVPANVGSYSGKNRAFYDSFRACWRDNLPRSCGKGSIGIPRSELGGNNLHNDHIHLEYPRRCAGGN